MQCKSAPFRLAEVGEDMNQINQNGIFNFATHVWNIFQTVISSVLAH